MSISIIHSWWHCRTSSSSWTLKHKHLPFSEFYIRCWSERSRIKKNLQQHAQEGRLAVIVDTSKLSNQTHNQTGILSICQCNEHIYMAVQRLKSKLLKCIHNKLKGRDKRMHSKSDYVHTFTNKQVTKYSLEVSIIWPIIKP